MIGIDEAVQRAIDTKSQIYNRKTNCPDDQRDAELRNLYAVDDWSSKTEKVFYDNAKAYNIPVTIIGKKSAEAADDITEPLAFVFVDGSHDIGIWDDVQLWPEKVMPGGIIAFHDYGVWKPTVKVKPAVDQWQSRAKWYPIRQVGSTIAFMRPQ